MNVKKKHLKYLFLLTVLLFVCDLETKAQPTCISTFRLTDSCNQSYLDSEFVFVGKVISAERQNGYPVKATVDVETPIKGEVKGRIQLFFDTVCFGRLIENQRYIFTANISNEGNFKELSSRNWSDLIPQEFTEKELKDLIAKVRSATKHEKQPRIVGVIERLFDYELSNDYLSYLKSPRIGTAADGTLVTLPNNYSKFEITPNYYRPFPQVVVEAKRSDGKRFTTKTNAEGKYEFKELPNGKYEVHPILSGEFTFNTFLDLTNTLYDGEPKTASMVDIDDTICSKKVDFRASVVGNLSVHISNLAKDWLYQSYIYLYRIDKSGFRDLYEANEYRVKKFTSTQTDSTIAVDFLIKGIPVGKYTIRIASPFYYPGVTDINRAEVIEIKTNTMTNINYSFPSSPKNN